MVEDVSRDDLSKDAKPILPGWILRREAFTLSIHNGANLSQARANVKPPFWAFFIDILSDLCHTDVGDLEWK